MARREGAGVGNAPAHETTNNTKCLAERLSVSCGALRFEAPQTRTDVIPDGLSVGVMLSGRMEYGLQGRRPLPLAGPCLFLLASKEAYSGEHAIPAGTRLKYASVQIDAAFAGQELELDLDRLAAGSSQPGGQPFFFHCPAARALQSLAAQILTCPLRGAGRNIYLTGKALELVALATCPFLESSPAKSCRLSSADIERLHAVREILMQEFQNPPSLATLAHRVGLNVKKLTTGFRALFGTSVFAFLQAYRLDQAYQMLASGEISVSEAAYRVGYSIAHFSTAFHKRFGLAPSGLRS